MEHLQHILRTAAKHVFDIDIDPIVEVADAEHGDFASNVAFQLAGRLKQAPKAVAEQLAEAIKDPLAESAAAAGPGFINLKMTDTYWIDELAKMKAGYGESIAGKGQKVQVEFISANPTGPLTMANARGGYLGDAIASVLQTQGYETVREHYLNDAGGQIGKLVDSIRHEAGLPIEGERQYSGPYVKELAEELKPTADTPSDELATSAIQAILKLMKASVKRMDIEFDAWFSEQSLITDGTVELVLDKLREQGVVYEKDGATWLRSTDYGDDRDRVLIKSNGEYIYLLNDIAYHYNIFAKRHFDKAIKIWGADHGGQVASLRLTVQQLLPKAVLDFVLIQMVRIMKDGQEFKSSKRAGTYITMEELLEEAGSSDVARFFFLMRSPDTQMDFDLDLAKEQSAKNPYFYVMYSYARAHSILAKAKEKGLEAGSSIKALSAQERALVRKLAEWPSLLELMAGDYGVHRLTFYGQDLAKLFHDFYESEKIIDLPAEQAAAKLYLVERFITFMDGYFKVLGITPQQRMEHEHK